MKKSGSAISLFFVCILLVAIVSGQQKTTDNLQQAFLHPPASAKPWVFWYWMHAAVSKEGITADLEAMKQVGIAGAYLMPIQDTLSVIPYQPTARQLSPEWWKLVKFAMQESKRLGLKLAMHVSDGFALAGGPWITPGLSMQKLVWTKSYIKNNHAGIIQLSQPETKENFYRDIAVFAFPTNNTTAGDIILPEVTTSNGTKANFLADPNGKESFRSDTSCWIQYKYAQPYTCRSITVHVGGNNYQAQRLVIQSGNDGINFTTITRLEPPRHGWQDTDEDYTYSIPATTATNFRFLYNKEGSEPGSEDLDAAKWRPSFKVNGIYLGDEPVINQYQAKNGSIWRVASNTTRTQVSGLDAVPLKSIIDLSSKMDKDGRLNWTAPSGGWVIVRIGHTSTGHTNYTGGAGLGLECDKFNAAAVQLQFDNWFGKAFEKTNPALAKEVLKIFHVDSWECGSQNWSPVFAAEFKKRRGYDLRPYLLVMTGIPVQDAMTSEKVLHDARQTIAELIDQVFYVTLNKLAHQKGASFSAESVAPTMVSDGLLHYKHTDLPMGEFWLNSPTHDKPNDMLDAISAAHIYGKNIVMSESFTSVRMNWAEYPGNLKAVGDRNFALGINKMVLHVFTQNPWMDRKPGMTLDGVGLYFQRDQTWFKQGKAWVDYLARTSALLQVGKPVVDIAVFTGEEIPRRSVLPDRLVSVLPGIFGTEKIESEKIRLANIGQPLRQIPDGVSHSANMADPEDWIDPLSGYAYDSFNPDALMMMTVKNGRVVLPGGASYAVLVIPGKHPMHPNYTSISLPVVKKIFQLLKTGATIIMDKNYIQGIGLKDRDDSIQRVMNELFDRTLKKGKLILSPYMGTTFSEIGLQKDVEVLGGEHFIAWTHRRSSNADIYFISNQKDSMQRMTASFRISGKFPEIWDPVDGSFHTPRSETINGRTIIYEHLEPNQSVFIVFRKPVLKETVTKEFSLASTIFFNDKWTVEFDKKYGGPEQPIVFGNLVSWSANADPQIRYYSGPAVYRNSFNWDSSNVKKSVWIEIDSVNNIASVKVNGINCGTLWTRPYRLDISKALKTGINKVEIEVSNTWHNRLIGDQLLPVEKRVTWTTAPFRLAGKPLLPAGLIGVNLRVKY